MYFVAIAAFGRVCIDYPAQRLVYGVLSIAIIGWWIFTSLKKDKETATYYRFGLIVASIGFMIPPVAQYWIGVLYIIASIAEKWVKFPDEIGVDEDGIVVNTFPRKSYAWEEINNMLIKDNLLTVDFKKNVLMQKELDEAITTELTNEFNNYCQQRIAASINNNP